MPENRYERALEEIRAEFPRFRLVYKRDSWFQKALHYGLVAVTLGGMRTYLEDYQSTIGYTIYVTSDWDEQDPRHRYITLRHELIHLRQFRKFTFIGMSLLYLLVPLPMGLAYFRARFEKEAFEESIRCAVDVYGLDHVRSDDYRNNILDRFGDASYGWMWPFRRSVERWYDRFVDQLAADLVETS